MKVRNKKCRICRQEFIPKYSTMQATCENIECMIAYSSKQKDKKTKAEFKAIKERNKSVSQWRKELQQVFNQFIRLRDAKRGCISCGKPLVGKTDAGHYYSVGSYPNLRFHEDNVHGQCVNCNQHKHGNLLEYAIGIEKRIGKKALEELKQIRNGRLSLPLDKIKELIYEYKDKVKKLKND
jgi:gamma-glutamylcyclotransferase (GGCT)/AIG2-like uncharacterized protein YtfP